MTSIGIKSVGIHNDSAYVVNKVFSEVVTKLENTFKKYKVAYSMEPEYKTFSELKLDSEAVNSAGYNKLNSNS